MYDHKNKKYTIIIYNEKKYHIDIRIVNTISGYKHTSFCWWSLHFHYYCIKNNNHIYTTALISCLDLKERKSSTMYICNTFCIFSLRWNGKSFESSECVTMWERQHLRFNFNPGLGLLPCWWDFYFILFFHVILILQFYSKNLFVSLY